jgi:hypothetical protein
MTGINEAIDCGDRESVRDLLGRNVFADGDAAHAAALAGYLFAEAARLDATPLEEITAGRLAPEPVS